MLCLEVFASACLCIAVYCCVMCDVTRCSPWMLGSHEVNGTCCARGRLLPRPEEEEANKNGLCNPVRNRGCWESRNTWTLRNPAINIGGL